MSIKSRKIAKNYVFSLAVGSTILINNLFLGENSLVLVAHNITNNQQQIQIEDIEKKRIGISAGSFLAEMKQEELDRYFKDMKELGISQIRFDADWSSVQPNNPQEYDWSQLDRIAKTAEANNIDSLIIITYAPGWAQKDECRGEKQCPPKNNDEFARFAEKVVARYKNVKNFEIWNEPNFGTNQHPRNDAKEYTELLKMTYEKIKRENLEAVILVGGLAMTGNDGINTAPADFIISLYKSGAKGYFDGIALHPHTYPGAPKSPYDWNGWQQIQIARNIMVENGEPQKKIWITEYGAPTEGPGNLYEISDNGFHYGMDYMSENAQAEMIKQALSAYQETDFVETLFIYNLKDVGMQPTTERRFGLIRIDGSKKPAYEIVKKAIAN